MRLQQMLGCVFFSLSLGRFILLPERTLWGNLYRNPARVSTPEATSAPLILILRWLRSRANSRHNAKPPLPLQTAARRRVELLSDPQVLTNVPETPQMTSARNEGTHLETPHLHLRAAADDVAPRTKKWSWRVNNTVVYIRAAINNYIN